MISNVYISYTHVHVCVNRNHQHDVSGDLNISCSGAHDPSGNYRVNVRTYDGVDLKITSRQKSILVDWRGDHNCRMQIRVVTRNTSQGMYYDWIAFGMGNHTNKANKFKRNWVFGQNLTHLFERGQNVTVHIINLYHKTILIHMK